MFWLQGLVKGHLIDWCTFATACCVSTVWLDQIRGIYSWCSTRFLGWPSCHLFIIRSRNRSFSRNWWRNWSCHWFGLRNGCRNLSRSRNSFTTEVWSDMLYWSSISWVNHSLASTSLFWYIVNDALWINYWWNCLSPNCEEWILCGSASTNGILEYKVFCIVSSHTVRPIVHVTNHIWSHGHRLDAATD